MNLHHLELFYYVARHGGISKAVKHMPYGIQQPALSSQIIALEQDLGAKLFDRQPFRLTAEGVELYQFAQPFFDTIDRVADRIRKRRVPKIRIAGSELILRDYLPHVISGLRENHSKLRFGLKAGNQADIEAWLTAGDIDLAITGVSRPRRRDFHYFSIAKLPLRLLVPAAMNIQSARELWARDLIEEPLICLSPGDGISRAFHAGIKRLKVDWPTSIEASSVEVITRYVANGYGIGVTVDLPALNSNPEVRALPLPHFEPIEVVAIWRSPVPASHAEIKRMIEIKAQELWPTPPTEVGRKGRRSR
ncbi:MAG TPA: LysR family transcriptional regulator [Opitutaceae bacterium]|nr:LysR family transcriptional regulator [Opitutaceae bacterium]